MLKNVKALLLATSILAVAPTIANADEVNEPRYSITLTQENSSELDNLDLREIRYFEFQGELTRELQNQISQMKKLEELNLSGATFPLDSEGVSGNADLEFLKANTNLKKLDLTEVYDVSNFEALQELKKLEGLYLSDTGITDLTPISELLNLEILGLSRTKATDFSPLKKLINLEELYLNNTQIEDLSVLTEMKYLEKLDLNNATNLRSIAALNNHETLRYLSLNYSLHDFGLLEVITDMQQLKELHAVQSVKEVSSYSQQQIDFLTNLKAPNLKQVQFYPIGGTYGITLFDEDFDLSHLKRLKNVY